MFEVEDAEEPLFKDPLVTELAWIIGSAPLISDEVPGKNYTILNREWFAEQLRLHLPWLQDLDQHPTELHEAVLRKEHKLLGKRFEAFVRFWMEKSPYFTLIASNLTLQGERNTLGEADLLVRENQSGKLIHLELACKFYLGYLNRATWDHWIGPNSSDTLDLKMKKITTQLNLFNTTAGKDFLCEHQLEQPEKCLMIKGYFFHHFRTIHRHKSPKYAQPGYPAGWFACLDETSVFPGSDGNWVHLEKHSWLANTHRADDYEVIGGTELQHWLNQRFKQDSRGVMVARVIRTGEFLIESDRGFIVGNHWPKN